MILEISENPWTLRRPSRRSPLSPTARLGRYRVLCGCVAGAASAAAIEDWLGAGGFIDIQVKPESREHIATWDPGRGIENYPASATIEARKPAAGCCSSDCCT
jgi:hypothetical protein